MRIAQKARVEHQIGFLWQALGIAKRQQRHDQGRRLSGARCAKMAFDQLTQRGKWQIRGVDRQIGRLTQAAG